jgi:hypothetical protein
VVGRQRRALHDFAAGDMVLYHWGDRPAELPPPLTDWVRRRTGFDGPAISAGEATTPGQPVIATQAVNGTAQPGGALPPLDAIPPATAVSPVDTAS